MFAAAARKIFGSANDRLVKSLRSKVEAINALESELEKLSDSALSGRTLTFRERLKNGETLDDILPEAFATVREAAKRVLGMRHFDVQMVGGMVLHKGMISEMMTGEGKTLVATLAAYLNAIEGKGVHVVTVNDYLAQRDAEWMGRIYRFLGLTVGCIVHGLDDSERKAAYAADITYGTNNEYGFDYLRDNMKFSFEQMVQRPFNFAIVDEVDSILIDEARTPLIISGPTEDNSELYIRVNKIIPHLIAEDMDKDEKARSVTLTEAGVKHAEELLVAEGILTAPANLYDINNISIVHHVNQALRAHNLFTRDVDYIVKDNKVIIIDEFTGRMMEGRRYSEGLHQALEAKENVRIQNENQTLASITFQNYFRLYPKLSGMTGTAMTEANEFRDIYKLQVVEIPTNVAVQRKDTDDEIYRSASEKYRAILLQIAECYKKGQPVLVGTVSIEKSEYLSERLKDKKYIRQLGNELLEEVKKHIENAKDKENLKDEVKETKEMGEYMIALSANTPPIPHHVLNARYHETEAFIVAQAGRPGAVTIATNMAGRGTDIKLGGNVEMLIEEKLDDSLEGTARQAAEQKIQAEVATAKEAVLRDGGLFVIGTERHESRRIDNQLRGRSGRQGDPGGSKFFLSLEDDLMRIFGGERMDALLQKMGMRENEAIQHSWMNTAIAKAQQKVEARNYEIRKNLVKFDDVMNDQRKVIYEQRIELIKTEDVSETVVEMRNDILVSIVNSHIPARSYAEQWDTEGLEKELFRVFNLHLPAQEWAKEEGIAEEEILERAKKAVDAHMDAKEQHFGGQLMRLAEKRVLLQTLDQLWKDHLLSLDQLRHGINLRAYGQRDPLNEYKQEAFNLFEHMLNHLRELVVTRLAHMEIQVTEPEEMEYRPQQRMVESRIDPALSGMLSGDNVELLREPMRSHVRPEDRNPQDPDSWGKVGRNETCPCGSGKKFKHCHGSFV